MTSRFFLILLLNVLVSSPAHARILLSIEGVVGAGKSTLLHILARNIPDICIMEEPFDCWQNVNGKGNLFKTFLEDKSRWSFTFQSYVFLTHVKAIDEAYTKHSDVEIFITDRSQFSGIHIFSEMFFGQGFTTDLEQEIYKQTMQWYAEHLPYKPDGFIYLKTSPTTACNRANIRNRELNQSLELDFFELLHHYHENWLIKKHSISAALADVPVLVIDGDVDFKDDAQAQQKVVSQIQNFILRVKGISN